MQGRAIKTISLCMLATILSGCVLQRSVRQGEASKNTEPEPIKPSSLSEYIRAVYKLSNEAAHKQTAQRETVFSQFPQLRELAARVESDATDAAARSQLVTAYLDHQLYWDAYHLLTDSQADDAEANLNLATIWDAWGQFELALKYGNRAIVKGASSAQAYELMGRINLHLREPAEAIDWYQRAAKHADNASVMANLGFAYMLVSDWENARISLERSVDLDATLPEPHNNLAMVLMKLGDEKGAIQKLLKAATSPVAFNNMGVLYLQEGKFDRARQFFEQALKLEPGYEVAQNNLKLIEAVTPPSTFFTLPSFEDHPPIPNVECPPPEPAAAPMVETDTAPALAEPANFVGPIGIVAPVVSEPEHPATNATEQRIAVASAAPIEQKKPEPQPHTEPEPVTEPVAKRADKDDTATSAPGRACMYSGQQSESSQTLSSRLKLGDPRLAMGGVVGLLATLLVVGRSRQPARPSLPRRQQNLAASRK